MTWIQIHYLLGRILDTNLDQHQNEMGPKHCPELGTLEWINFNPDFLIRISTVETFHFCPNPHLFLSP